MVTVNDIKQTINRKKERKYESFEKILDMCFNKIERYAHIDKLFCLFEVPDFVLGKPLFDINECILFLMSQLQKNGFKVTYMFPRLLRIDWQDQTTSQSTYIKPETAKDISLLGRKKEISLEAQTPSLFIQHHAPNNTKQLTFSQEKDTAASCIQLPIPPPKKKDTFIKSIADFKPSGKFVLNLS